MAVFQSIPNKLVSLSLRHSEVDANTLKWIMLHHKATLTELTVTSCSNFDKHELHHWVRENMRENHFECYIGGKKQNDPIVMAHWDKQTQKRKKTHHAWITTFAMAIVLFFIAFVMEHWSENMYYNAVLMMK